MTNARAVMEATTSPDTQHVRPRLPRVLGGTSYAAIMVGLIIGSGIFRVPSAVAGQVESVGAIGALWLLGGLLTLCGALSVVELACMFPRSGGEYVYLRETYGPLPSFLFGWTRLLLLVPASLGAISLIFASYLGSFLGVDGAGERWLAAGVIALLTGLNYRSVRWGAVLENVLTAAKVIALASIALLALAFGDPAGGALARPLSFLPASWSGFGLALVTVMWTYSGWNSVTPLAGELKDPSRTLPPALIGGVALVVVIYLLTNAAYLYVLPVGRMAASSLVAADAATAVFGAWGARLVAGLVVAATFGAVQAILMSSPRTFYAMAEDGLLFGAVGRVHKRFLTPHVATLLTAALGIGYLSLRSFEQLAQAFVLGIWPFHVLMIWGVIRLRRLRPDLARPYHTPGYPMVPLIFLLASVAMILNALVHEPLLSLFGFGLILAGVPIYVLVQRRRDR